MKLTVFGKLCYNDCTMRTINISVTDDQRKLVDRLVAKLGFANRSEFFRTLLRRITTNPELAEEPKLSTKALRRYEKMIKDIETGKEPVFKADSVEELLDHLYGRKRPVRAKVPEKL